VSEEVKVGKSKMGTQRLKLFDKALRAPQGGIVWPVGRSATELIVEDDATLVGKSLERVQITA